MAGTAIRTRLSTCLGKRISGKGRPGRSEVSGYVHEIRDAPTKLDSRISRDNRRVRNFYRANEMFQRIRKVKGFNQFTAAALVAAVHDRTCCRNGCQFAALQGLVHEK